MKQEYLPDIGSTGRFTLKTPYDTLVKPNVLYTCKAIRNLNDCLAEGLDPFSYYYESVGLTEEDYNTDLMNDVSIVSLQTKDGEWLFIPSNYIIKFPNMNGIVYRAIMLGISIGAIPDTMKLDALKTSITNLVHDTLGIDSVVKEVIVSVPAVVSKENHDTIETVRLSKIINFHTDSFKLNKTTQDLTAARLKITELENFIKTKLNI